MAYICRCAQAVTGRIHGRAFSFIVGLDRRTIMRFSVCWRILKLNHGTVFKIYLELVRGGLLEEMEKLDHSTVFPYRVTPLVLLLSIDWKISQF